MNRIAVSCALTFALFAPLAHSQPAPAACPVAATLDQLTQALDDAVSGPRNKDRACLGELLLPAAVPEKYLPGAP